MQPREKIMDDVARIAGGAAGFVSGLKRSVRDDLKSRAEEMAERLDLVPRADFERLEAMLMKARAEQQDLQKRVEELEKKLKQD